MFLAFHEIRRAPVRFGLLAVSIGLLLFLVLFQQALQSGLLISFVGAVRNQTAPILVYGIDAQRALQGSVLTPEVEADVLAVDGVGLHDRLGETTVTVEIDGDDSEGTVIGTDGPLGQPTELADGRRPAAPFEAIGSSADFSVGDRVRLSTAGGSVDLDVVGTADDVQLSVTPTMFTDFATYEAIVREVNPDATAVLASALALAPVADIAPETLVDRINAQVGDADAATREEAAETAPGVAEVRQSFRVIFLLYAVVVPLVTGLFFLILTLQKSRSLVLLRAIGARAGVLVRALIVQVLAITSAGIAAGAALVWPLAGRRIGGVTLRFDAATLVAWATMFVLLAVAGAIASLQRIRRVDPHEVVVVGAG